MPPGGGFPFAHVHEQYEEVFYVLEGEVEYRLGEGWTVAPAGTTVCVPRGVVHAFRNASQAPAPAPGRARAGGGAGRDRSDRHGRTGPME